MKKTIFRGTFFWLLFYFLFSGIFNAMANQVNQEALALKAEKGGYQLIDLNGLWELYQTNRSNLLLVDTRQEWEYDAGFIKGAVNFPIEPTWFARLTQRGELEQFLGPDKKKNLVFY